MTDTRRPISLLTSVALGLGGALLLLLAGGPSAAAAPARAGLNPPLPAKCFARDDSATGTVYSSADSAAVRSAVAAAVPSDTVRLAGACNGVAAQGGTTQTVLINKVLTVVGGYTTTDWAESFPITQPTILDAQGLGRVITASADITIAELTVQHGISFGGDGGGIFARGKLTLMGAVNILSNTTGYSPIVSSASGASLAPSPGGTGNGGGAYVRKVVDFNADEYTDLPVQPRVVNNSAGGDGGGIDTDGNFSVSFFNDLLDQAAFDSNYAGGNGGALKVGGNATVIFTTFSSNIANTDGGGAYFSGNANIDHSTFTGDAAGVNGGGFIIFGMLQMSNSQIDHNSATNGAGFYTQSGATLTQIACLYNVGTYGGGCWAAISESQVNATQLSAYNNQAVFGSVADMYQVLALIYSSQFNNNTSQTGTLYFVDATGRIVNSSASGNRANEGRVVAVSRFLRAEQLAVEIAYLSAFGVAPSASSAQPLASTSVLTGSAFSSVGISLEISDTIVSGFPYVFQTDSAPSSTIRGDYNLFDAKPVISGTNITTGTHSLVGNPMFADNLGHLSAGSPAIDHGIDVGIYTDLDGNPRPSGHGFDIGAYEFQVAMQKLFLPLTRK